MGVENGPNGQYEVHTPAFDPSAPAQPPNDEEGDVFAALAIGNTLGAANKATLIGVQTTDQNGEETVAQAYEYWRWIILDVYSKNLFGKAVTSYSACKNPTPSYSSPLD